jgi:hypothetical protein
VVQYKLLKNRPEPAICALGQTILLPRRSGRRPALELAGSGGSCIFIRYSRPGKIAARVPLKSRSSGCCCPASGPDPVVTGALGRFFLGREAYADPAGHHAFRLHCSCCLTWRLALYRSAGVVLTSSPLPCPQTKRPNLARAVSVPGIGPLEYRAKAEHGFGYLPAREALSIRELMGGPFCSGYLVKRLPYCLATLCRIAHSGAACFTGSSRPEQNAQIN